MTQPLLRRSRAAFLASVAVVFAALTSGPSDAQSAGWTSPYPLILTPARALAMVTAADRGLDYVPGEVVVKFRNGVSVAGQERALSMLRARPAASDLRWIGPVAIWADPREQDAAILAATLASQPEVEYAEPNFLYRVQATPNDPSFATRQWNLQTLDLPRAWDINPGANSSTIIAIVDTGVTTVNATYSMPTWDGRAIRAVSVPFAMDPEIAAARLLPGQDLAFWTGPVLDMEGHGSHVAGTAGQESNNGVAEAGIAYRSTILPVKVCVGYWEVQFALSSSGFQGFAPLDAGGCPTAAIAQGVRFAADSGAKAINLSLGGTGQSLTLRDAINYAVGKGAVVAISMGNEYEEGNPTSYPAAFASSIEGAMAVAAVGRSLRRSYYSNTGAHAEIAAPGGDVRDGGTAGLVWQYTLNPGDSNAATVVFPRFDRYVEAGYQGTSMAAPHVTGTAALLASQGVTSPAAVEALIVKTARDLGSAGQDNEFGAGLIQPRTALFGFGVAK